MIQEIAASHVMELTNTTQVSMRRIQVTQCKLATAGGC